MRRYGVDRVLNNYVTHGGSEFDLEGQAGVNIT